MDKNTLSNYGWIVIAVLILAVMIALATPFGKYVKSGAENTLFSLIETSDEALNAVDMSATTSVLDSGKCGSNLRWKLLSDGTLRISGTGAMYDYAKYNKPAPWYKYRNEPYISDDGLTILNPDGTEYLPTDSYYNSNPNGWHYDKIVIDKGVTYIGNWAFYRACVDTITIPEGVESTGCFAIRYSPTLKTVNLPNSLKTLGDFAISRNTELTTINFGNGLEKIGTGAFATDSKLTTAILPESVVQINEQLNASYGEVDYSATGLFQACSSLKEVELGNVSYIPQRTFLSCTNLEEISIPNTVLCIDEYAFANCTNLKTITFEEGSQCTTIKSKAFVNASAIESITGCTALEIIETQAFEQNSLTALTTFEFSDTNKSFQQYMFANSKITTATIGSNVTELSQYMFYMSKIKEIHISNSVTKFDHCSIRQCYSLKDIYYYGTRAEWDNITKSSSWCTLTPNSSYSTVVHFLSDGTTDTLANCK